MIVVQCSLAGQWIAATTVMPGAECLSSAERITPPLTQKVMRFMSGYATTRPSDAAPSAWLYWFSCSSTARPALSWTPTNPARGVRLLFAALQAEPVA